MSVSALIIDANSVTLSHKVWNSSWTQWCCCKNWC